MLMKIRSYPFSFSRNFVTFSDKFSYFDKNICRIIQDLVFCKGSACFYRSKMLTAPFLPSPLTDFSFLLAPHYRNYPPNSLCSKLEKRFYDCLEAYGASKAREKCADVIYDMIECQNSTFQKQRVAAIRQERMRQYRSGKLDKPFDAYPPMDSYLYIN